LWTDKCKLSTKIKEKFNYSSLSEVLEDTYVWHAPHCKRVSILKEAAAKVEAEVRVRESEAKTKERDKERAFGIDLGGQRNHLNFIQDSNHY